MATVFPVEANTLIEYNSNNLEENKDEEKEAIHLEFTEENADPTMKLLLTLDDRMYKKDN